MNDAFGVSKMAKPPRKWIPVTPPKPAEPPKSHPSFHDLQIEWGKKNGLLDANGKPIRKPREFKPVKPPKPE